jgi:hypothetical protein
VSGIGSGTSAGSTVDSIDAVAPDAAADPGVAAGAAGVGGVAAGAAGEAGDALVVRGAEPGSAE